MVSPGSLFVAARTGAAALRANPVRALLATLGVVIGSAALVAVLAVSDGVEQYARVRVARQGFDRLVVRPQTADSLDGQWIPRARLAPLGTGELERLATTLQEGERAVLATQGVATTRLGRGGEPRAIQLRGIAVSATDSSGPALLAGRRLRPDETRSGAPVAVVNARLAAVLLGDTTGKRPAGESLADSLMLGSTWVRVVGVVADDDVEGGRRAAMAATVPFGIAAHAVLGTRGLPPIPMLTVITARAENVLPMRRRLEAWLARADSGWRRNYQIQARTEEQLDEIRRGMLIFRLLMGSITGITLLVGGIGIMNVLLASVAERTREIGVRKAVGARRRDILLQFLAESVTITGAGSAIGTALGLVGAYGVTALMRAQTQAVIHAATTPQTLLISAALAVLVGVAFGVYPASRAARLAPIEAIHTE